MKTGLRLILAALAVGVLIGCDDDDCVNCPVDPGPAAPQGVFSITGNEAVYLYWNGPYEGDIVEYLVYRSLEPLDNYREIGRRDADPNPNLDLIIYEYIDDSPQLQNGVTYWYAVASVDRGGRVSELSAENVFDTPRPEGMVALRDVAVNPSQSGFHLATQSRVDTALADIYVDRFDGVFYLNAANLRTDLQDMGHTQTFDDIGWAPGMGWSQNGWSEIATGHTYVIRTGWPDNVHFAKMRVEAIDDIDGIVSFRWAYQVAEDNPELAPGKGQADVELNEGKNVAVCNSPTVTSPLTGK